MFLIFLSTKVATKKVISKRLPYNSIVAYLRPILQFTIALEGVTLGFADDDMVEQLNVEKSCRALYLCCDLHIGLTWGCRA